MQTANSKNKHHDMSNFFGKLPEHQEQHQHILGIPYVFLFHLPELQNTLNIFSSFYYRSYGRFLDGGLIANNPSLDCLTEINEYNLALEASGREAEVAPITVLVSLGTGNIPVTEVNQRFRFDYSILVMFTTTIF